MKNEYIIESCPHCNEEIIIYKNDYNCKIFRHGVFKKDLKMLDPHSSKEKCKMLKEKDLIFGCGKPFRIIQKVINNEKRDIFEICDYI